MNKFKRLEVLFLLVGLIFLIPCCILGDRTLDINVHDTYFIISYLHLGILFFIIHVIFALIYLVIRSNRNYTLGLLHLILGAPLYVNIIFSEFLAMGGAQNRYYTSGQADVAFDTFFSDSIYYIIALFVFAQLLFSCNIFIVIYKSFKNLRGRI